MSKKLIWTIVAVIAVVAVLAVAIVFLNPKVENVEGTLTDLMAKVYGEIPAEELPMMLGDMPIDSESAEYFLGTADVSFKEALANEPMISSIAHSVVLVRLNDARDAKDAVEKIKTSVNPSKWLCATASKVIVESRGDLVILIMSSEELAPKLEANFKNL